MLPHRAIPPSWLCNTAFRKARKFPSTAYRFVTSSTIDSSSRPPRGTDIGKVNGCLFIDSVFPVRLGTWDPRHYIASFQEQNLVEKLEDIFNEVDVHGFEISNIETRIKDGGIFVDFRYSPLTGSIPEQYRTDGHKSALASPDPALVDIEQALVQSINAKGGVPSWIKWKRGRLWRVKGSPWREDLRRYASPILRISFEGPDVGEERVWQILRPYGRIRDIKPPTPVPAGTQRFILVTFERMASATIAHSCIHGAYIPSPADPKTFTRLHTGYELPIKPHVIRDWLTSHPRIVFPIIVFLIGALTYTVFDPIRAIAVEAKVMGWFDYRTFALTKWIRHNGVTKVGEIFDDDKSPNDTSAWEDRKKAENTLQSYLSDYPTTITFVHGPAGSGKSRLLRSVLERSDKRTIVIDCQEIYSRGTDAVMVKSLADQTGYWPMFSFLNSFYNLVDLASVGLIGQKAGLSSSLEDQVSRVLGVVGQGLRRVSSSRRKEAERRIEWTQNEEKIVLAEAQRRENIRRGVWHDGRIDCIAGNGLMSELGVGIEGFGGNDEEALQQDRDEDVEILARAELNEKVRKERKYKSVQEVEALPVVVIKNYDTSGKSGKAVIAAALADWSADLITTNIAHVIVVSDNRENAKRLAKALPTKPLNAVELSDVDPASSLRYIKQKLQDAGVDYDISPEETKLIERLGGRASDLDTIIHKVHAGQNVTEGVEDIIQRGVAELRKNAFGDDSEDAERLAWTRQQAWTIVRLLAQKDKLQYYQVLLDFPFKGNENALRAMEHAELISISTVNGRPWTIGPGKPIHRYVFERLLSDRVFQATQEIACNELIISGAESTIKSAEAELVMLKDISIKSKKLDVRVNDLTTKLQDASRKIGTLENRNRRLKDELSVNEESKKDEEKQATKRWWLFG
ncbi:RNA12 protein-domain-containing protein [Hysterangium stoloniferum]|nr:RNA12 protein-domain-containing protein [Hysterangium stoloniferum]